jgi:hypothetical protein
MNWTEAEALVSVHLAMQAMLLAWVALVVLIIRRTIAAGSVGLPAGLVLIMTALYGGAFVYAVPGYTHLREDTRLYLIHQGFTEWMVVQGTFVSLLAILGFALGCGAFARPRRTGYAPPVIRAQVHERSLLVLLGAVGAVSYLLHVLSVEFPLSGALIEAGRNVGTATICLGMWLAFRDRRPTLPWLLLAALIPLYYVVVWGFTSFGFMFGLTLLAFWLAQRPARPRGWLRTGLVTLAAVQGFLTLFIGWFSFRDQVRATVWRGEGRPLAEILSDALQLTEVFSPWNFYALDIVNIRLNLTSFIGRMIEHHAANPDLKLWGATLVILPFVLVPRFLWPGKPERGGSEFMSEHTGTLLSTDTSFGTGSVFEFYINYGAPGVLIGFVVLGWLVRRIDRAAVRALFTGDFLNFARWFAVGAVALDPLIRPFFMVNGMVMAWLLMTLLILAVGPQYRRAPDRGSLGGRQA